MNTRTKLSAKGQVVIPKDVRDALGLEPGQTLEVVPVAGGLLLRKPFAKSGLPTNEVLGRIRERIRYCGPPLPVEQLGFPSPEEWRASGEGSPDR